MRAIRIPYGCQDDYLQAFQEACNGRPGPRLGGSYSSRSPHTDFIDRLTDYRIALANAGYEKEVAAADKRFLEMRLSYFLKDGEKGPLTQEEWDKRWDEYWARVKTLNIRGGVKPYPEDAL